MGPPPAKRLNLKEDNRSLLYPNDDFAKGIKKGTAVMRQPTKIKNKDPENKIAGSQSSQILKRNKKKYIDTTNIDKGVRPNIPGVIFNPCTKFESEIDEIKRLLRKLNEDKHNVNGISSYDPNYNAVLPNIHGVVIKAPREKTINRLFKDLDNDKTPGPGKYHADDRVIKDKQPEFIFGTAPRLNRTPSPDRRKQFDINLDVIKKRPIAARIMPEHTKMPEKLDEKVKVGPATYFVSHDVTEPRQDIGVMKMIREHEKLDEFDDKPNLYPDYDYDKTKKLVPVYKQPSDVRPIHIPDKVINPEKWKFYDPNLDAIKEVQQQYDFAQNLKLDEFIEKEEFNRDVEEYKRRHEKQPGVYSYDPQEPDTKILYDFGKREPRYKFEDNNFLEDFENKGDVLVLNPDKIKKRAPGFEYAKMKDRFDIDLTVDDTDHYQELNLEPSDKLTKKRVVSLVNIDKDKGRAEAKIGDHDDMNTGIIDDNFCNYKDIIPNDPSEPKVVTHNFGKVEERFKKKGLIDDETPEELVLNPDPPKPKKPTSNFGFAEERFKPPRVPDDPWHDEQPINEMIVDIDKLKKLNSEGHYFDRKEKLKHDEREEMKQRKEKKKEKYAY